MTRVDTGETGSEVQMAEKSPMGYTSSANTCARPHADGNQEVLTNSTGIGVVATVFIALHFVTKPLYLYPSGLPQISDGIVVLMFLTLLLSGTISQTRLAIAAPFCAFAVYAASINLFWYANYQNTKIAESAVYYLFNGLVFVCFYCALLRAGPNNARRLGYVILLTILAYFSLSFLVTGAHPFRGTLFFNNPNQLAYFLILTLCIVGTIYTAVGLPAYIVVAIHFLSAYLMLTTISRAGVACFALIVLITFYKKAIPLLIIGVLATMIVVGGVPSIIEERYSAISERYERRFDQLDEGDGANSVYGRGYHYIFLYPQYVLFGAGEGVEKRLNQRHEPHSSWVALVFCYGIVGSSIFFYGCWKLLCGAGFSTFLYVLPPALFGITHQGLRFTTLWVLFAFIAYAGVLRQGQRGTGSPACTRHYLEGHLMAPPGRSIGRDGSGP